MQYNPYCACFTRLATDFFGSSKVGPAFSALLKFLRENNTDFDLTGSEASALMKGLRIGKMVLDKKDVTPLLQRATQEYKATLSELEIRNLQRLVQEMHSFLNSTLFRETYNQMTHDPFFWRSIGTV